MYKKFLYYLVLPILFLSFYLLATIPAFASFLFTPLQTIITPDQILNLQVNLSLQGQAHKNYYLEAAFLPENGSRYFGETWNGLAWIPYLSSTNFQDLQQILTDESGNWNGTMSAKIDTTSPYFTGPGDYTLKLKRFTDTGSSSWADIASIIKVVEEIASPSATLTDATPSASVILTSVSPTPEPTISPMPSPSESMSPSPSPISHKSSYIISTTQTSIDSTTPLNVSVSITNLTANTQYYLKGAFFKDGSTNYFGQTLVNGNWIKENKSYSLQFFITTDINGDWQGNIQLLPDTTDSGFLGTGGYQFKIARYTEKGSLTWSNQLPMTIIAPIPTPTPHTSTTNTSSQNDSSTQKAITNSATTKINPTASSNTLSPVKIASLSALANQESTVEGIATTSGIPLYEEGEKKADAQWILISIGILCVIAALGYTIIHQKRTV